MSLKINQRITSIIYPIQNIPVYKLCSFALLSTGKSINLYVGCSASFKAGIICGQWAISELLFVSVESWCSTVVREMSLICIRICN